MTTLQLEDKLKERLLKEQVEWEVCSQSPVYFLKNYCWIQDRALKKSLRWQPWNYLTRLVDDFGEYDDIVILKARQLGITWLACGYALWTALFNESAKVLMFSQGEAEAWELISKCRYIWSKLPDYLKLSFGNNTRSWLTFNANDSEIKAYPSTAKAGRSTDATLVIRDELEKHENAAEHFASVRPTIDAGGKMIDLSTIDKSVADSHFQDRINRILSGQSRAHLIFLGWRERPERTVGMSLDDWFEHRIKSEYPAWQIENEYPATIEEALKPSKVRSFFDTDSLEAMKTDCDIEPIRVDDINTFGGMIKIYKMPVVGNRYCVFTDPSDGVEDPHYTVALDRQTGEQVAESHGMVKADICGQAHDTLVRYYFNAFNSYELNASAGGKFEDTVENLETPNRAPFISPEGKPKLDKNGIAKKWGWWTSPQLKRKIIYGLEEAVRKRLIRIHSADAINELSNFIVPEGEEPQSRRGWHDDRVMALAGAWELTKHMPTVGRTRTWTPRVRS